MDHWGVAYEFYEQDNTLTNSVVEVANVDAQRFTARTINAIAVGVDKYIALVSDCQALYLFNDCTSELEQVGDEVSVKVFCESWNHPEPRYLQDRSSKGA